MPDIALLPATIGALGDLEISGGDVVTDAGLETSVYLSLFTDAYDSEAGEGGYWGDAVDDQPGGSLLWTLRRSVITPELPGQIEAICADALQWLLDAGIAQSVDVTATITGQFSIGISVSITQASQSTQYSFNWSSQAITGF